MGPSSHQLGTIPAHLALEGSVDKWKFQSDRAAVYSCFSGGDFGIALIEARQLAEIETIVGFGYVQGEPQLSGSGIERSLPVAGQTWDGRLGEYDGGTYCKTARNLR